MESVLAPKYYRHINPDLGVGTARVQEGAGPFVILATDKFVYATPKSEVVEITKEEYENHIAKNKLLTKLE